MRQTLRNSEKKEDFSTKSCKNILTKTLKRSNIHHDQPWEIRIKHRMVLSKLRFYFEIKKKETSYIDKFNVESLRDESIK